MLHFICPTGERISQIPFDASDKREFAAAVVPLGVGIFEPIKPECFQMIRLCLPPVEGHPAVR